MVMSNPGRKKGEGTYPSSLQGVPQCSLKAASSAVNWRIMKARRPEVIRVCGKQRMLGSSHILRCGAVQDSP